MTRSRNERINSLCLTLFEPKRPWQRNWSFCWYRLTLSREVGAGILQLILSIVLLSAELSVYWHWTILKPRWTLMNSADWQETTASSFFFFFFLKTAVDNSLRYIWKMGNIKDTMLAADQHREDRINILHLTMLQQPRALLQELGTFAYLDCHNVTLYLKALSWFTEAHQLKRGVVSRVYDRVPSQQYRTVFKIWEGSS